MTTGARAHAPSKNLARALGLDEQSDWTTVELAAMQIAAVLDNVIQEGYKCDVCSDVAAMVDVTRHVGRSLSTGSPDVAKDVAHGEAILDELGAMLGTVDHSDIVSSVKEMLEGFDAYKRNSNDLSMRIYKTEKEKMKTEYPNQWVTLALDALRGKVTGLDADRIESLMGAR